MTFHGESSGSAFESKDGQTKQQCYRFPKLQGLVTGLSDWHDNEGGATDANSCSLPNLPIQTSTIRPSSNDFLILAQFLGNTPELMLWCAAHACQKNKIK